MCQRRPFLGGLSRSEALRPCREDLIGIGTRIRSSRAILKSEIDAEKLGRSFLGLSCENCLFSEFLCSRLDVSPIFRHFRSKLFHEKFVILRRLAYPVWFSLRFGSPRDVPHTIFLDFSFYFDHHEAGKAQQVVEAGG